MATTGQWLVTLRKENADLRQERKELQAQLKAVTQQRDALRGALEAVEFVEGDEGEYHWEYCPWCAGNPGHGHHVGCARQLALALVRA